MFEEILAKLALALDEQSIPYMIIGGQAVLLYGEPRLTRDIDVTLGVDVDALSKILEISKGLNLKPIPSDIVKFVKQTMVLPTKDRATGVRVDFIFSFTPYERQAIKRARKVPIKRAVVKFASVEDVIIHKVFAGRARDLDDVRSILLKNPSVNLSYIEKWLTEFDKSLPDKGFSKKFKEVLNSNKRSGLDI
ncbi:nucleotidyl transferase AbiEii/AbiGii toxin family protein [Candidatus Aerophobetes bacterium]|nr:nucleotidyl transferase AbiEii/AbiGii toxin family protein [Candidatus Aerophobetes bacterium]